MTEAEILERMKQYSFYHSIQLTEQIVTPGWQAVIPLVNMTLRNLRTLDLKGKRVLDIGCRDCVFAFEAERLGAKEVIAIDNDPSEAAAQFLIPALKSGVKIHEANLMDLTPRQFGKFDVVIFPGVLYHLRHPYWAIKLMRDLLVDDGQMVLETAVYVDDNRLPLLFCPIGAESPYEPTSCTFFNVKGLTDTLYSLGLTVQRVEFLHSLKANPSPEPGQAPAPPVVDRATFICQMTPQTVDRVVASYWDGTHRFHTRFQGIVNDAAPGQVKELAAELLAG